MTSKCPRCRKETDCEEYQVQGHKAWVCRPCSRQIVLEWIIKKLDIDVMKES
jgi:hypothetical protein